MQGEYGLKDMFFGAPVQLGRTGVEKIFEYSLDETERVALNKSAEAVRQTTEAMLNLVKF